MKPSQHKPESKGLKELDKITDKVLAYSPNKNNPKNKKGRIERPSRNKPSG